MMKWYEDGERRGGRHGAQSAFVGGGRSQPILSASRFGAANEGSSDRRHPLLWAAGFIGVLAVATALLILFVR